MSVIFGSFNRIEKKVHESYLHYKWDALAYWKADKTGSWSEDSVFLGHRMLWNTPESKLEHLPSMVQFNNQTLVITIDARLDNREVLIHQLQMEELSSSELTDSNLILEAYKKWGESCPQYLLGDFTFVIWDAEKELMFCVRDHIGIKPFYYYMSDDIFIFSNDIRGVLAHPAVCKKYNDRSIAMFLSEGTGFYDTKDTFYKEIQKLPAATSMSVTKKSVSKSVYWDIENITHVYYDTYEEYVDKLRELLLDAVNVRLRTVYQVASHLSGGLDSSAISVLAARELKKRKQPLYALNWIETPEGVYDSNYSEWGFTNLLEKLENIEQINIHLTAEISAALYDKIDITVDDVSFFWNEYLVRDEAEKHGARTILSGWGGDELISDSGRTYFAGLFQKGEFKKAIKELNIFYEGVNYKFLRISLRCIKLFFYVYSYIWIKNAYVKMTDKSNSFEFVMEPFLSFVKKFSFWKSDFLYTVMGIHDRKKAFLKNGHLLYRIENWASSAIGNKIEYSYPLLDKRIVEFALAIPEELYAPKKGQQRLLFKDAISNILPNSIARASKNYEPKHWTRMQKIWRKSISVWMENNETDLLNRNQYINRSKVIASIKNKSHINLIPILISNLKNKD